MEELETQPEDTSEPEPVEETAYTQPQTVSIEEWMAASEPAEEEAPQPAPIEDVQLMAVLEACVYVAEEPLMPAQIAAALNQDPERIRALLQQLMAEYERPEHGVSIKEVAGGYKMATKAEHHEAVRSFVKSLKAPLKLSLPALETLAVVAYKQPVTSPEIMDIRGVQGGGVLKTLLDRKLITEAGRKNVIGKPILYKTTKEFLIQFGLKDLSELPTLKEFEEIRRMSMADSDAPEAEAATAQSEAEPTEAAAPALDFEASGPEAEAPATVQAEAEPTEVESPAPGIEVSAPEAPAPTAAQSEAELTEAESPAPGIEVSAPEAPALTTAQSEAESVRAESPASGLEASAPEAEAAAPEVPAAEARDAETSEPLPAESPASELTASAPEAGAAPPPEPQEP